MGGRRGLVGVLLRHYSLEPAPAAPAAVPSLRSASAYSRNGGVFGALRIYTKNTKPRLPALLRKALQAGLLEGSRRAMPEHPLQANPRRPHNGYLLIESMIAITIVLVGLLGIFALLSRSLSLNRVVADRFVAAYLAAEGVEIVKNIADNNVLSARPWNSGLQNGDYEVDYRSDDLETHQGRQISFNSQSGSYGYGEPNPTNFQRLIRIESSSDGEELIIKSKVNWVTRGGGRFEINLEDHLFNWQQ